MPGKVKIGIMGGTFDPIHYGHLLIAEVARHKFDLQKIIFIPTGSPPHKKVYQVSEANDRLKMVELAITENINFALSTIEINRTGLSYTVDTMTELSKLDPETEYYVITGADAIVEILTWERVADLAGLCYFIAATRPGYDFNRLDNEIQNMPDFLQKKIFTIEIPGLAISSTEIRKRVMENQPIRYLLPDKVAAYIGQRKLYK